MRRFLSGPAIISPPGCANDLRDVRGPARQRSQPGLEPPGRICLRDQSLRIESVPGAAQLLDPRGGRDWRGLLPGRPGFRRGPPADVTCRTCHRAGSASPASTLMTGRPAVSRSDITRAGPRPNRACAVSPGRQRRSVGLGRFPHPDDGCSPVQRLEESPLACRDWLDARYTARGKPQCLNTNPHGWYRDDQGPVLHRDEYAGGGAEVRPERHAPRRARRHPQPWPAGRARLRRARGAVGTSRKLALPAGPLLLAAQPG